MPQTPIGIAWAQAIIGMWLGIYLFWAESRKITISYDETLAVPLAEYSVFLFRLKVAAFSQHQAVHKDVLSIAVAVEDSLRHKFE